MRLAIRRIREANQLASDGNCLLIVLKIRWMWIEKESKRGQQTEVSGVAVRQAATRMLIARFPAWQQSTAHHPHLQQPRPMFLHAPSTRTNTRTGRRMLAVQPSLVHGQVVHHLSSAQRKTPTAEAKIATRLMAPAVLARAELAAAEDLPTRPTHRAHNDHEIGMGHPKTPASRAARAGACLITYATCIISCLRHSLSL